MTHFLQIEKSQSQRPPNCRVIRLMIGAIAISLMPPLLQADVIKLKNGGEIRGTIERRPGITQQEKVTITTLNGIRITVERKDFEFISWRKPIIEEYETRLRKTRPEVASLWELAEWCRKTSGLAAKRLEVLERIIKIDPDHAEARAGLRHEKHNGQWMTRDEKMAAMGYVKYGNRYITQQEFDLKEKSRLRLEEEQKWFKDIRLWHLWLTGRHEARQKEALELLQNVNAPDALPGLERFFKDDKNKNVRMLYVQALGQIGTKDVIASLVEKSLRDSEFEVRIRALEAMPQRQFAVAAPLYVKALKSDSNRVVRHAATALSVVGNQNSIPAMIDALVTTHTYQIRVPRNDRVSFRSDGTFGNGQGTLQLPPEIDALIRAGQLQGMVVQQGNPSPVLTKLVPIRYQHRNEEVLEALKLLTDKDFGYDERTWHLWWAARKAGAG